MAIFLFSMHFACGASGIREGSSFFSAPRYLSTVPCRLDRLHPGMAADATVCPQTETALQNRTKKVKARIVILHTDFNKVT
jgi:hypothetical protein